MNIEPEHGQELNWKWIASLLVAFTLVVLLISHPDWLATGALIVGLFVFLAFYRQILRSAFRVRLRPEITAAPRPSSAAGPKTGRFERSATARARDRGFLANGETALLVVCMIVLVFAATSDWRYAFYVLLRLLICASSLFAALKRYSQRLTFWMWCFGVVAVLYNPLVPMRMARADWQSVNIVTAVFLACWILASLLGIAKIPSRGSA